MDGVVDVWLLRFREPSEAHAEALAKAFGIDVATATRLCEILPQCVKRGTDARTAARLASVLEALGGDVETRPSDGPAARPSTQPPSDEGVPRKTIRVGGYDPAKQSTAPSAAPPTAAPTVPDLIIPTMGEPRFVPTLLDDPKPTVQAAHAPRTPSLGTDEAESPYVGNAVEVESVAWREGARFSLTPVAPDPPRSVPPPARVSVPAPKDQHTATPGTSTENPVRPVAGYRPVLGIPVDLGDEPAPGARRILYVLRDYAQPILRALLSLVPLLTRIATEDSSFQGRADWIGVGIDGLLVGNLFGAGMAALEVPGKIEVARNARVTFYVLFSVLGLILCGEFNHLVSDYELAHRDPNANTPTAEQIADRLRRGMVTDADTWLNEEGRHFGPMDTVSSRAFVRSLHRAGATDVQVPSDKHNSAQWSVTLIIDLPFGRGVREAVAAQVRDQVQSTRAVHSAFYGTSVIVVRFNPVPPEEEPAAPTP